VAKKHSTEMVPANSDTDASKIAVAILGFVGNVPSSDESRSRTPAEAARKAANTAAAKAATAAGTLALPPGPLGWLTILPEMTAVWKIQAQMVADIAALYGKSATLGREQMLYCLFKHAASQAVRDLVVRVGERMLVRRATLASLQVVAQRVGVKLTQRVLAKGVSRWIPLAGAVGVAAYAYYDTVQVAKAAIDIFERDIEVDPGSSPADSSP
jgi:uncharacterized protein (DUF697 family)